MRSKRSRSNGKNLASFEQLERRQLLASSLTGIAGGSQLALPPEASYVGSPKFFYKAGGYLTKPAAGDARDIALSWVQNNAAAFGLAATDVRSVVVADAYREADSGINRVYLKQTINGLLVENTDMAVTVMSDGRILSASGNFVSLPKKIGLAPQLSVTAGLQSAAASLKLNLTRAPQILQQPAGTKQEAQIRATEVSRTDIPAQVHYVVTSKGVKLAWEYVLDVPSGLNWYSTNIDAANGELLYTTDHIGYYIAPGKELTFGDGVGAAPKSLASGTASSGGSRLATDYTANYNVYGLPLASPSGGPRAIATNPWDLGPSPFGWQDTDADAGAESNTTQGNNVSAQEDRDANDTGGVRPTGGTLNPDGSGTLTFDNPLNFSLEPTTTDNQLAAITNLYYWNNTLHDVYYRYGFTEAARNFQQNNYGNGGVGNDRVNADAQDGSGTNNANFGSFTDGTSGRMQMYLFTAPTPDRDGDLDAEVMAHEYGHGVSNRMSGTGAGLTATQSRGMGEGWGDYFGLMLTLTDGSVTAQNKAYPVGTYVLNQPLNGAGIRRQPYSNNMAINTQTFAWYGTGGTNGGSTEVHNTGELWVAALWDVTWNLISKYGFNPDITQGYGGTPANNGNTLALKLVFDGIKGHGANPSFLQARDAILAADQALNGGADIRELWTAFARRGLGFSATTTGSTSTSFNEAFDLPPTLFKPFVASSGPGAVVDQPLTNVTINFSRPMDTTSFSVVDDVQSFSGPAGNLLASINGFSWTNNQTLVINYTPTRANGNYSMVIGPNILATDGTAMDQNGNDVAGEPGDTYTAVFSKSGAGGPRVTSQTPTGAVVQPTFASIDVVFSEAMNQTSFDVASDVVSFAGPGGTNLKPQISGFTWQNSTTLRLNFISQGTDGTYTLTLAPTILANVDGAAMDQNANGSSGEPIADRYIGTVSLDRFPGPDAGGYEASPTPLQAIDLVIGAPGVTTVVNGSDDAAGTIALPAGNSFTYYGTNYTTLFPNANGLITFGSSTTAFTNTDLTTTPTQASIAICWDDWRTDLTGPAPATDSAVLWQIVGNNLIVEWSDVTNRTAANGTATFQAILSLNTGSLNGDIIGNYPDLSISNATYDEGASATLGIKNTGTQGTSRLLVQQNVPAGNFMGTGKAVRFTATKATGQVFADDNGDGVLNNGEQPVPFAHIYADANNNGVLDNGENAAFADAGGIYSLTSLVAGDNVLRIDSPDYINTQPNPSTNLLMGEAGVNRHVGTFNTALVGTAGADILTISANGAKIDINRTLAQPPTYSILASVLNKLSWDGLGGGDDVNVAAGPSLKLIGSEDMNAMSISNGASAFMPAGTNSILVARTLAISAGSTLDLNDNDLLLDYTGASQLAAVQALINSARAGGAWTGSGLTSTSAKNNPLLNTTLGAMEGSDFTSVGGGSFDGVPVPSGAVLVKYTYYGDTDFNGLVNFDDYSRADAGFNSGLSGWFRGDFDGNGLVNFDDYSLIDLAFNSQAGAL
ncbi:hypothetical protein BH09PLA1_BH09PLA1_05370 [soil metagenome]